MSSLSTKPNLQKLIYDVQECVGELKRECSEGSATAINDDSKTLQRFCAKLEYLLQHEQIDHSGFLGGRKDYWNYIYDGLLSTKGVRDGLKYVKTLSELKTNLGRGRAFIRFALMYQHLADSLQQCVTNYKLTSEWYNPGAVWRNEDQCRFLIGVLYDLNDVHFDLGAKGYDLDNGWPTFARRDVPTHKWNLALSRASSHGSLNTSYGDASLKMDPVPFFLSPAEETKEERLVRELDQSELVRSDLCGQVYDLEARLLEADSEKDVLLERLQAAVEQSAALESQYADLQHAVAAANDETFSLREQTQSQIRQLVKERDELMARQDSELHIRFQIEERLSEELRALKSSAAHVEEKNLNLVAQLNTANEDRRALVEKHAELRTKLDQVALQLSETDQTKDRLAKEVAELHVAAARVRESEERDENCELTAAKVKSSLSDPKMTSFNLALLVKDLLRANSAYELPGLCAGLASQVADCIISATVSGEEASELVLEEARTAERNSVNLAIESFTSCLKTEVETKGITVAMVTKQLEETTQRLQQAFVESDLLKQSLQAANSKLAETAAELVRQVGVLSRDNERLATDCERLLRQVELKDAERRDLQADLRLSTDTLNDSLNKIANIEQRTAQLISENQRLERESADSLALKDTDILQLRAAAAATSDKFFEDAGLVQSLRAELAVMGAQFADVDGARVSLDQALKTSQAAVAKAEAGRVSEQRTKQQTIDTLLDEVARLSGETECLQAELNKQRFALSEDATALEVTRAECARLRASSDSSAAALENAQEEIAMSQKVVAQQRSEIERIVSEQVVLVKELADAKKNLDSVSAAMTELQRTHDGAVREFRSREENSSVGRSEAVRRLLEANTERDVAVAAVRQREAERDDLSRMIEALTAAREDADRHATVLETERDQATASLDVVAREFGDLKEALHTLKQVEVEKGVELARLQVELDRTRKDFERNHVVTEQQMAALKYQLSSQQLECEMAVESYKAQQAEVVQLSELLSQQEQLIAVLETELESIKEEKGFEHNLHMQQLGDLSGEVTAKDEEKQDLTLALNKAHDELAREKEAKKRHQDELVSVKLLCNERLATNENELHQLREDNSELKKKLVKLIKDKDNLWQKTDMLVYRQKQKAEVKWREDESASHCTSCRMRFSLTLRKHHCRMCGGIFCYNCSNNWVMTASSSRKARVCGSCFADQSVDGSLNSSVLEASMSSGGDDDSSSYISINGDKDKGQRRDSLQDNSLSSVSSDGATVANDTSKSSSNHARTKMASDELGSSVTTAPLDAAGSGTRTVTGGDSTDAAADLNDRSFLDELPQQSGLRMSSSSSSAMASEDTAVVSRQVQLLARDAFTVPVQVEIAEMTLLWEFSSEPKGISFSVTYRPEDDNQSEDVLIPMCKCNSHKETIKGSLVAHLTGTYSFIFDNTASRSIDKLVSYSLHIAKP